MSLASKSVIINTTKPFKGRRIAIIGNSGSGKTTLAKRLANKLEISHIELDALHFEPNWTNATLEVFEKRVSENLKGDAWIVDGNYSKVRSLIWARADTVIWLNYPLAIFMARLLKRTLRRVLRKEELWSGNRESLRMAFLSRESVLWWALRTYRRRRREYPIAFQQPKNSHLAIFEFKFPKATEDWFSSIDP